MTLTTFQQIQRLFKRMAVPSRPEFKRELRAQLVQLETSMNLNQSTKSKRRFSPWVIGLMPAGVALALVIALQFAPTVVPTNTNTPIAKTLSALQIKEAIAASIDQLFEPCEKDQLCYTQFFLRDPLNEGVDTYTYKSWLYAGTNARYDFVRTTGTESFLVSTNDNAFCSTFNHNDPDQLYYCLNLIEGEVVDEEIQSLKDKFKEKAAEASLETATLNEQHLFELAQSVKEHASASGVEPRSQKESVVEGRPVILVEYTLLPEQAYAYYSHPEAVTAEIAITQDTNEVVQYLLRDASGEVLSQMTIQARSEITTINPEDFFTEAYWKQDLGLQE